MTLVLWPLKTQFTFELSILVVGNSFCHLCMIVTDMTNLISLVGGCAVYEETAGLMVNDPVLRTHKVSHNVVFLCSGMRYSVNTIEMVLLT